MTETTLIRPEVFVSLLEGCAWAVLPLGIVALAVSWVVRGKGWKRLRLVAPVLWLGGYAALLWVAKTFGYELFSQVSEKSFTSLVEVLRVGGLIIALRPIIDLLFEHADARFAPLGLALRAGRDWYALWAAIGAAVLVLDLSWNTQVTKLPQASVDVTTELVTLLLVISYFVGLRTGLLPAVVVVACCCIGLAQFFVISFKGVPFLPSDLTALSTAAAVSGNYQPYFDKHCLQALEQTLAAVAVLSLVHPMPVRRWWHIPSLALNVAVVVALVPQLQAAVVERDYRSDFDLNAGWYWYEREAYEENGMIPTFMAYAQDLQVEEPEGYSEQAAQAALQELVQVYDNVLGSTERRAQAVRSFEAVRPSIVFIMNESFADLSIMDGLGVGYEGPPFFNHGMPDALSRGNVAVSVFGGGTEASEFELLTGVSMGYLGSGKSPYTTHDFTTTTSVVDQLEGLGYQTTAIHPNYGSNWNRDVAYEQMGFDRFLTIDDFEGEPLYHSGVRDSSTYDKIRELLRSTDEPQFVFDVTMANHGGYTKGPNSVSELDWQGLYPEGAGDKLNAQLNEYLACINASDVDLSWFIKDLREMGRPVVLVFFGDHQPGFSDLYNDLLFPGEDQTPLAHRERCYQTPYVIWTNYDVQASAEGETVWQPAVPWQPEGGWQTLDGTSEVQLVDTSVEALAALAFDLAGVPLTDFQKATLAAHTMISQINAHGYRGEDGVWYASDAASYYDGLYAELRDINYYEFGSKYYAAPDLGLEEKAPNWLKQRLG